MNSKAGRAASQLARHVAPAIPGFSEAKAVVDVGRDVWDFGTSVYDGIRGRQNNSAMGSNMPKSVAMGTVAVPSKQASYASGTVGNAIASRSGMGVPVAFRNMHHPQFGPTLRLRGTQVFSMITRVNGSTAALSTVTSKKLRPYDMQYLVALLADVHQCYRFNSITLRYLPGCPTTTYGQVRFAYLSDPSAAAFDNLTYISTAQSPYQMTCAAWEPASLRIEPVPCAYAKLYQYDSVAAKTSDRTTTQGLIAGFWADSPLDNTTTGTLEIDYEIDLFDIGPSLAGLPTLMGPLHDLKIAEIEHDEDAVLRARRSLAERLGIETHPQVGLTLARPAAAAQSVGKNELPPPSGWTRV